MRFPEQRAAIIQFARRLGPDGLAVGTAGNLSVRVEDLVLITPSGIDYEELEPGDLPVVDLAGEVVEGGRPPSSELPMHLEIYRGTDAGAIVHTHSLHATALSTLVEELPPIHYLIVVFGGRVPAVPYETPGSDALAWAAAAALKRFTGCLLQNHGAVAVADSLERAYARARLIEWLCELYSQARALGEPRLLYPEELERAAEALHDYGL